MFGIKGRDKSRIKGVRVIKMFAVGAKSKLRDTKDQRGQGEGCTY